MPNPAQIASNVLIEGKVFCLKILLDFYRPQLGRFRHGYSENLLEWYAYMGENIRSAIYGKIHFNLTMPKFVSIIKIKNFGMKQEIL